MNERARPDYRIGVDVGGTKVLAVATPTAVPDVVLHEVEQPTPQGDAMLEVIELVVGSLRDRFEGPPTAVGVGMPGLVDRHGVLRYGPNLPGALDLDVAGWLAERQGCPVVVDNDGNCAAWAEHALGAGDGCDNMAFVGLGTGISSGLVIEGQRVRGVHGFAGESGHMILVPDGPRCACGRNGCWEAMASGTALAEQARAAARERPSDTGLLCSLVDGDVDALLGEHVTEALRTGDPLAATIADTYARWVALGVANLVNLVDPEVVVLGGSVLTEPAPWMERIVASYREVALRPGLRDRTSIVPAALGRRAGAVGAALIAG